MVSQRAFLRREADLVPQVAKADAIKQAGLWHRPLPDAAQRERLRRTRHTQRRPVLLFTAAPTRPPLRWTVPHLARQIAAQAAHTTIQSWSDPIGGSLDQRRHRGRVRGAQGVLPVFARAADYLYHLRAVDSV